MQTAGGRWCRVNYYDDNNDRHFLNLWQLVIFWFSMLLLKCFNSFHINSDARVQCTISSRAVCATKARWWSTRQHMPLLTWRRQPVRSSALPYLSFNSSADRPSRLSDLQQSGLWTRCRFDSISNLLARSVEQLRWTLVEGSGFVVICIFFFVSQLSCLIIQIGIAIILLI